MSKKNVVYSDMKLADEIAISMPAVQWAILLEWLGCFSQEERPWAATYLGNLLYEAVHPEAWRKQIDAERHEKMNAVPEFLKAFGIEAGVMEMSAEDFTETVRCTSCGRLPNPVSAPCPDCKDFNAH